MGRSRRASAIARTVAAVAVGFLALGAATTDGGAHTRAPGVAQRPSIVLILTDDQPAQTLWAMPRTKRLLAAHGVRFTSLYDSVSLCCPARATLLTGRYAHSTSVYANAPPSGGAATFRSRHDDRETLAVWLHRAGYRTALFGKYLNGYQGGYVPPGWDEFTTSSRYWGGVGYVQGVKKEFLPTTYMPTFLGAKTIQFIRSTPRGGPLFAYYAPFAPHGRPSPRAALCAHAGVLELSRLADARLRRARPVGQAAVRATATVHAGRAEGRAPLPQAADTHAPVGRRDG